MKSIYKAQIVSDHVAKFQGDRSRDLGESVAKKKKTSAVKQKPVLKRTSWPKKQSKYKKEKKIDKEIKRRKIEIKKIKKNKKITSQQQQHDKS